MGQGRRNDRPRHLGGTSGCAIYLNNREQVVGYSNLAEDLTLHPFLWERGIMRDLGTLGGNFGFANWISDSGEVAGTASTQGDRGNACVLEGCVRLPALQHRRRQHIRSPTKSAWSAYPELWYCAGRVLFAISDDRDLASVQLPRCLFSCAGRNHDHPALGLGAQRQERILEENCR